MTQKTEDSGATSSEVRHIIIYKMEQYKTEPSYTKISDNYSVPIGDSKIYEKKRVMKEFTVDRNGKVLENTDFVPSSGLQFERKIYNLEKAAEYIKQVYGIELPLTANNNLEIVEYRWVRPFRKSYGSIMINSDTMEAIEKEISRRETEKTLVRVMYFSSALTFVFIIWGYIAADKIKRQRAVMFVLAIWVVYFISYFYSKR